MGCNCIKEIDLDPEIIIKPYLSDKKKAQIQNWFIHLDQNYTDIKYEKLNESYGSFDMTETDIELFELLSDYSE